MADRFGPIYDVDQWRLEIYAQGKAKRDALAREFWDYFKAKEAGMLLAGGRHV